MRKRLPLAAAPGLFASSLFAAVAPKDARAGYERPQKWQFSPAVILPASQESFTRKLPAQRKNVLCAPESSLLANGERH